MKDILLEDISKVFGTASGTGAGAGATTAVDRVTLAIRPGEFFFLLGPSGCGKTTLLRIIAGLTAPTAGRVLLGGRDVTVQPVEKRNTAMVFQNYALWPHMTVRENVEFGPKMRGVGRGGRREIARANLRRVQMESYAHRKPSQLSGGQQQRVALARALAAQPDCLLLDEPLSNLDARLRLHMRQELRGLVKSTGTTAVYVTHDQKEALSMADRIAVMNAGRVVQIGAPQELYDRPASRFVADFLGEANFLDGTAGPSGQVDTAAGSFCVPSAAKLSPGERVTCCVRPERVLLAEAGAAPPDGFLALPATVLGCVYMGELRQYTCRLSQDVVWRVSVLGDPQWGPEPGQTVSLQVAMAHVAVLVS